MAQKWISVKEQLPEIGKPVIVLLKNKKEYLAYLCKLDDYSTSAYVWFINDGVYIVSFEKVLSWIPIPSFDDILEANKDVLKRIKEKGD